MVFGARHDSVATPADGPASDRPSRGALGPVQLAPTGTLQPPGVPFVARTSKVQPWPAAAGAKHGSAALRIVSASGDGGPNGPLSVWTRYSYPVTAGPPLLFAALQRTVMLATPGPAAT